MDRNFLVFKYGKVLAILYHKEMEYLRSFLTDEKYTRFEEIMKYCYLHEIHVYLQKPEWWDLFGLNDYRKAKLITSYYKVDNLTDDEIITLNEQLEKAQPSAK